MQFSFIFYNYLEMSLKAGIFPHFEKDKTDKLCKINYANGL